MLPASCNPTMPPPASLAQPPQSATTALVRAKCHSSPLRQARERLGQGLRAVEAGGIGESDGISLRNP
jgi:hypothetical protein